MRHGADLVSDPAQFVQQLPGRMWLAPCRFAEHGMTISGFDFPPNRSTLRTAQHAVLAYRQPSAPLQRWPDAAADMRDARVGPGDVSLKDSGSAGGWAWAAEISVVQIHIDPALLDRTAAQLHGPAYAQARLTEQASVRDERLSALVHALAEEAGSRRPGRQAMVRALTVQLMVHLVRHHCEIAARVPERGLRPQDCRRLSAYIANNLHGDLSVAALAALVQLGPDHFSRAFRAGFDCAPHQYVLQARLALARRLLDDSTLPLAAIAGEAGFTDQSHMCRWFKRAYGVTPGQCRPRPA
jgi:AraC family transcriptional regulator